MWAGFVIWRSPCVSAWWGVFFVLISSALADLGSARPLLSRISVSRLRLPCLPPLPGVSRIGYAWTAGPPFEPDRYVGIRKELKTAVDWTMPAASTSRPLPSEDLPSSAASWTWTKSSAGQYSLPEYRRIMMELALLRRLADKSPVSPNRPRRLLTDASCTTQRVLDS